MTSRREHTFTVLYDVGVSGVPWRFAMFPALVLALAAVPACVLAPVQPDDQPGPPALRTTAERSGFNATSRYEEVRTFLDALRESSPLVRTGAIGSTREGRDIPLVIVADPPVATPEEAAEAQRGGRLVVLLIGNIHAGEVDGKEALLALARDLALAPKAEGGKPAPPLDRLVLCFVPIYNADGNERMGKDTRPGQNGPAQGQGVRENADGLDLNRDFVKLEAPETRALVRFMTRWDPGLVIDTHTTNGSYHRYVMTYSGIKHPACDPRLVAFTREVMLPEIAADARERAGLDSFFYGNFNRDRTRWEDYPAEPRYGINSVGLRNRLGLLTESYSYAPYGDRVRAQYEFMRAALGFAASRADEIARLEREADEALTPKENRSRDRSDGPPAGRRRRPADAPRPAPSDDRPAAAEPDRTPPPPDTPAIALRTRVAPFDAKVTIKGWVEEQRDGRARPTDEPKDYEVEHWARFDAALTVARPWVYVIPADAAFTPAVETLQRHGIDVEELREDLDVDAEVYAVDTVTRAARPFQGHETVVVDATARTEPRRIRAGSLVVRTSQRLGTLAAMLLEPAAEDGLTTWNFFDAGLEPGKDFPVLRVPAPAAMLTLPARALPEDRPSEKQRLTFELIYESDRPPSFNGSPTRADRWLDDERFVQTKDGRSWRIEARTGRAEPIERADTDRIARALAELPTIGAGRARQYAERFGTPGDEEREGFFFEHENDLYYCRYDGTGAARLTSTPQREELASFSPDGRFVAFVRDNDLWVVDVATHAERALTTGGTDRVRSGKADWVYFEEVFNRSWRVYWWSPDSTRLAYLRVDSTPEKTFTIVNNVPGEQVVEVSPYPRPGEPNPRAALFTVSVGGGEPRQADLSAYDAEAMLVTGVGWRPDSSALWAFVQNRTQTWLDLVMLPADGGPATRLMRETTRAWVDAPPAPTFLKDGSFLLLSERTGWKHLYHFEKDGSLRRQVTDGAWEVRSIAKFLEDPGVVFFSGTKDSHIASNLYRVNLDGSGLVRLTPERGSHQASLSPGGKLLVDTWSTIEAPPRVVLRDAADGSLVRVLDTNPVRTLEEYVLVTPELVTIPTADGFELEGHVHLPPGLDESRRYPVWFQTYAGPHAPTVSDAWQGGRTWDQVLAQAGYIVFRSDPRSASGKGAVSAWTAYKRLGVPELEDIEAAIRWLSRRPYVDAGRIGMAGHSYGGFMTAFALTHSELFAAGIAGAPVTDWRDYDTIYTERFMLTPQENPEGYEATSVVRAAAGLHGRLLLTHGMMDDNVHLANNTKLIHALQRANKPFEMMLYPEARHGIGGRHYQRLQYDFIRRALGGPADPAPRAPTEQPPEPRQGP